MLCLALVFVLCACGAESERPSGTVNQTKTVDDLLREAESSGSSGSSGGSSASGTPTQPVSSSSRERYPTVEIDLTEMNSTMVYSEVYNMVTSPDEYLGKVVRMRGAFRVFEAKTRNYYACLIADATACCAQGIEFVPADKRTYPNDFPEVDQEVTVVGVFDKYYEGEKMFCQLIDAEYQF